MGTNNQAARDYEAALVEDCAGFSGDPLGWVLWAYDWGVGDLAGKYPYPWQLDYLKELGKSLSVVDRSSPEWNCIIRRAVRSGHGVGKSALVAWLVGWAMATHEDTRGVITANTGDQLSSKSWAEVAKWHKRSRIAHWFEMKSEVMRSKVPGHEKTWIIHAQTWSLERTEAFAGLHNEGKRIFVVFDEASGIPDEIWEVVEGATTDANTEIIWLVFGNPTQPKGRFRECWGRQRHRWDVMQVDSRTVPGTNKELMDQWVTDWGEDSDFVKVRVKGDFPSQAPTQFISSLDVEAAAKRDASTRQIGPVVIGVDTAYYGDDMTVIQGRRGRDAKAYGPRKFRQINTQTIAGHVAEAYSEWGATMVYVDLGGESGGGVVDLLRAWRIPVLGVHFAEEARDKSTYANRRAEMYGECKKWLQEGGAIPDDPQLKDDLSNPEYGFTPKNQILLESKKSMKGRGLASPDCADALALTFYAPLSSHGVPLPPGLGGRRTAQTEYDVFNLV